MKSVIVELAFPPPKNKLMDQPLTRIRDPQLEHYVTELEEKNLAVQSEDPKTPFSEADRKRLIELISALQLSAQQQIEGNKK